MFAEARSASDDDSIYTTFSSVCSEREIPMQHGAPKVLRGIQDPVWLPGSHGSPLFTQLARDTEDQLVGSGQKVVCKVESDRAQWRTESWNNQCFEDKHQFSEWRMRLYRWRKMSLQAVNGVPARLERRELTNGIAT